MSEKPTRTNNYDSLTCGKLCPLKGRGPIERAGMRVLMDAANGLTR